MYIREKSLAQTDKRTKPTKDESSVDGRSGLSRKANRQPGSIHRAGDDVEMNSSGRFGTDVTRASRGSRPPDTPARAHSRRHRARPIAASRRPPRSPDRPPAPAPRRGCIASTWTRRSTRCAPIRARSTPPDPRLFPAPLDHGPTPRSVVMLTRRIQFSRSGSPIAPVRLPARFARRRRA